MKYINSFSLLENLSYAKAILRKLNIPNDNENYKKIIDKTKGDGYTGIITKIHFQFNIDIDETLSLYDELKKQKIDLSQISKLSYEEIIDLLYKEEDNYIVYLGEKSFNNIDYKIFHVKTYEAGLTINSPAWCLKSKSKWNYYSSIGENVVFIDKKYIKGNNTSLPTPNTFFSSYYSNNKYPDIRLGVTVYYNDYQAFNDNNVHTNLPANIISYLRNTLKVEAKKGDVALVIKNLIEDRLFNLNGKNFSNLYHLSDSNEKDIDKFLNTKFRATSGLTVKEFIQLNQAEILNELSNVNGLYDIILYKSLVDTDYPLGGYFLSETDDDSITIKYSYGFLNYKWGRKFIEQSYKSESDFLEAVAKNTDKVLDYRANVAAKDVKIKYYKEIDYKTNDLIRIKVIIDVKNLNDDDLQSVIYALSNLHKDIKIENNIIIFYVQR